MNRTIKDQRDFESFLFDYYVDKIKMAKDICSAAIVQDEERTAVEVAVFNKIARPSFYLNDEFKVWNAIDHTVEAETETPPQLTKNGSPKGTVDATILLKRIWKGKKLSDAPAKYEDVHLGKTKDYGWDFCRNISKPIIDLLRDGPLNIEGFQFKLSEDGQLVQASKKKARKWKDPR